MSYAERVQKLGLASKEEILQVLTNTKEAVILDVRTSQEIQDSGKFEYPDRKWLHVSCTPTSAEDLTSQSDYLVPNKDTPIVVYCRSGGRANTARKALEGLGYTQVINAGGYDDIVAMGIM